MEGKALDMGQMGIYLLIVDIQMNTEIPRGDASFLLLQNLTKWSDIVQLNELIWSRKHKLECN